MHIAKRQRKYRPAGPIEFTPDAADLAADLPAGFDWRTVKGSGRDGRITVKDVRRAIAAAGLPHEEEE